MTLPERASSQQHGAEGVVRAWVATDPVAASEWVATLPSGGTRNGAIYHLVEGIKNSDPAAAFQWANSIEGDLDKRLSLLKRATSTWTMSSPDDAKSAIEGLSLPVDQKKPLFDQLRY